MDAISLNAVQSPIGPGDVNPRAALRRPEPPDDAIVSHMADTSPLWSETAEIPPFPAITADVRVDVLVIGGGITGITAAYLLKKAGRTVALIERGRMAMRDSGHTTAHVTCV